MKYFIAWVVIFTMLMLMQVIGTGELRKNESIFMFILSLIVLAAYLMIGAI
jgi:membrane-bound acyltransferase YfiQ involved in biofilm formation